MKTWLKRGIPFETKASGRVAGLRVPGGVALSVGAIVGSGVLVLPSVAARTAGPAAVLVWAALAVFSLPVAWTFAELGGRYPGSGGVAAFVGRVFGQHAAGVCGSWFFFALPLGAPATAFIGAQYVADAFRWDGGIPVVIAAVLLLVIALLISGLGIGASSRTQLLLGALLVTALVTATLTAIPYFRVEHLTPFAPAGVPGMLQAGGVLFFSFAGWEAVTHLSGQFAEPRRDLRRVAVISVLVVAVLYIGFPLAATMTFGASLGATPVPLTAMLAFGLGAAAPPVTAVVAVVLTIGAMVSYLTAASHLGVALAASGTLHRGLADPINGRRRSLLTLGLTAALVVAVTGAFGVDLAVLLQGAAAAFAAVTVAGSIAGTALLPRGSFGWCCAVTATVGSAIIFLACGWGILLPAAVALLTWAMRALRDRVTQQRNRSAAVPSRTAPGGSSVTGNALDPLSHADGIAATHHQKES